MTNIEILKKIIIIRERIYWNRPSCWTDWRWPGGVRLATVRPTKNMNSLTLERWKYPKWLTSIAFAKITGSDPSGLHFNTNSAVIFISPPLSTIFFLFVFLNWISLYLSKTLFGFVLRDCSVPPFLLFFFPSFLFFFEFRFLWSLFGIAKEKKGILIRCGWVYF